MGDVNGRGIKGFVKLDDFAAHLNPEFCIEVGEWLIHQEDFGVANDGAAESDTLTLTTGEGFRLAIEVFFDLKNLGGIVDPLIDLRFRQMADLKAKRHAAHGLRPP